jgi:flavodoxin
MKTLVIYYSYEGTTKRMADMIAIKYGFDVERLEVVNEKRKKGIMKYVWGGGQVLQKKEPELKELRHSINDYDRIIIGTPVWASSFAPAIRSFLKQNEIKGKEVAFFCTYMGGEGHTLADFREELKENKILGELRLNNVLKEMEESKEAISTWVENL